MVVYIGRLAGVGEVRHGKRRLTATRIRRGADVAHRAVGTGLEVADDVVMRERHRGQRRDVGRNHEPEKNAQPGPGCCHGLIIACPYRLP